MTKLTSEQIAKAHKVTEKLREIVGEENFKSALRVSMWINSRKGKVVDLIRKFPTK